MAVGGSGRRGVQSVAGRISGSKSELDMGAQAFYELSKRLKQAGGTGKGSIRNEMHAAVKRAAKPLPKAMKQAARDKLPKRGGLNERIAKRTPKVVTRTGVTTAGLRIQDNKTDPRINAEGRLWHPIFGRKGPNEKPSAQYPKGKKNSTVTKVPGAEGYFDDTARAEAEQVRDDVVAVLEDYARRLVEGNL